MKMFLLMQALLAMETATPATDVNLSKIVVIVDVAHGGVNPGFVYKFSDNGIERTMVEKFYTCRTSAYLIERLEGLNIMTVPTIYGKCLDEPDRNLIYPSTLETSEFFTSTGEIVNGTVKGLRERLSLAKQVAEANRDKHILYIAIHFDLGWSPLNEGTYIIVPPGRRHSLLATSLEQEFQKDGLTQLFCKKTTVVVVHDTCGIPWIRILGEAVVPETVLIELANVTNEADRRRIIDPQWQQMQVDIIVRGILEYAKRVNARH